MRLKEQYIKASEFEKMNSFVEEIMKDNSITDFTANETLLVLESLYHNLIEQGLDSERDFLIQCKKSFGELKIRLGFGGKVFSLYVNEDEISPENSILKAYADKIDCSYFSGFNLFTITVKRNYKNTMMFYALGILLAFIVYIPVSLLTNREDQLYVLDNMVFPIEKIFVNCVLMVAAPVTFFSFVKNMTDTYILADRNSNIRILHFKSMASSLILILLAIAVGFVVAPLLSDLKGINSEYFEEGSYRSIINSVESLVPSSIIEPFETESPIPLIIIAILMAYTFCSVGAYFNKIKKGIDICYTLFSKMLSVIMYFLPFFFFMSIMDVLLYEGFESVVIIFIVVLFLILSLVVVIAYYAVRLSIKGVNVMVFIKKLCPLLIENLKINSAIDAAPFNIRYCAKNYGFDRERLKDSIPVLAQINLDGNCYLLTLCALMFIYTIDINVSWLDITLISMLILFVSMGAPNQPGSCMIGIMMVICYFNVYSLITMAIYIEVFLSGILNLTNVVGDIVTVAVEDVVYSSNL